MYTLSREIGNSTSLLQENDSQNSTYPRGSEHSFYCEQENNKNIVFPKDRIFFQNYETLESLNSAYTSSTFLQRQHSQFLTDKLDNLRDLGANALDSLLQRYESKR